MKVRRTHTFSYSHTHAWHSSESTLQCSSSRGRTGGGVEVRTDHFGIKVAAAADMKSSNELVGQFGEFLHWLQTTTKLQQTETPTVLCCRWEEDSADEDLWRISWQVHLLNEEQDDYLCGTDFLLKINGSELNHSCKMTVSQTWCRDSLTAPKPTWGKLNNHADSWCHAEPWRY